MDMGGTSFDVSLMQGGEANRTMEFEIEWGLPVFTPMIDVKTIGAGGGSVGWVDKGGLLRVGPESAGASPGPACYGRGGTQATVTDANLFLGRINPGYFLGGELTLDEAAAQAALENLGGELGMSAEDVAVGNDRAGRLQHGQRDQADLDRPRARPARVHAGLVRRRGLAACGRASRDHRHQRGHGFPSIRACSLRSG